MRKNIVLVATLIAFVCAGLFFANLNVEADPTGEIVIHIDQSTGLISRVEDEKGNPLQELGTMNSSPVNNERKKFKSDNNKKGVASRFSTIPVEMWEKVGNTVCYIQVNNNVYKIRC